METKIENMSQIISEEYETQLFGFSVRSFCEQMQEMVFSEIKESAKAMEKALIKKRGSLSTKEEERIVAEIDNLIKTHTSNSSSSLMKIKELINDNFKIPKNVLLPEDAIQENKSTEEEIELKNEISKLKSRILRAKSVMAYCQDELNEFEENEDVFNKFKEIATPIEEAQPLIIINSPISDLICEISELPKPTSMDDIKFYDNAVKYLG